MDTHIPYLLPADNTYGNALWAIEYTEIERIAARDLYWMGFAQSIFALRTIETLQCKDGM
jgi:hypothetical protein